MRIEFQRTIIDNFCSLIEHQVFDFAGRGAGLHYIYGENRDEPNLESNGSGKSSLFDAMCWCQFGRTTDGRKAPDIRPRHYKGTTRVTNVMAIDGNKTVITRQANPNTLTLNGKTCTQEQIDVYIPFGLFAGTVLIGQGQPLFFDLKPAAKMELFSDALGLERWEERSARASKKATAAAARLDNARRFAEHWETVKAQLDETIDKIKERMSIWSGEQQERIAVNRTELELKEKELEKQTDIRGKADLTHDGAAAEVLAIENKLRELEDQLTKVNSKNNEILIEINSAGNTIKFLKESLGEIEDADKCPTCGQSITGLDLFEHRKEIKRKIKENTNTIEALNEKLLTKRIDKIVSSKAKYRTHLKEYRIKADNARSTLDRLIPVCAKLETEIQTLKEKIENDITSANPYRDQMNMNRKSRVDAVAKIREYEDSISDIERRIDAYKFWVKGFKDIRLYVIDEVLKDSEAAANNILDDIGLIDWDIRYKVERTTLAGTTQRGLNVLIKGPRDRQSVKWQCWSKGEGQRLRLVGSMALSDVLLAHAGIETNLEIFDEPTAHMTKHGVDDLCELLAQRAESNGKIVFFIDHKAVESSHFTSSLKVIKSKDGRSMLVT